VGEVAFLVALSVLGLALLAIVLWAAFKSDFLP